MKYVAVQFHIKCEAELLQSSRDLLADALCECGFESFEETEDGVVGYVQKGNYNAHATQECLNDFPIDDVVITFEAYDIADTDWNETWENDGFDPILIENRMIIFDAKRPIPSSPTLHPSSLIYIGIEARMAFGTGTHETTRMVVSALLDIPLKGLRVLDCGCGTGILGISALKLGASEAVGYDIDEWSVENAKHNAQLNKVKGMTVLHGDSSVLSHVSGVFDVVLANINRNILLSDLHYFKDVMKTGATIILSGFYEEDIPLLLAEAEKFGLHEKGRKIESNWACLTLA
ncbi:MAG: 50S ribosomal protein L11 methyltransferase [Prevotella sp.]|nr:50S ribosomal protein L11 methyltransferase [Prevotella sp.]